MDPRESLVPRWTHRSCQTCTSPSILQSTRSSLSSLAGRTEASPRSVDLARGCQSFRRTGSSIMMEKNLLWWEFLIIERDIDPPLLVVPAGPEIDQGSCDECRNHVEVSDI